MLVLYARTCNGRTNYTCKFWFDVPCHLLSVFGSVLAFSLSPMTFEQLERVVSDAHERRVSVEDADDEAHVTVSHLADYLRQQQGYNGSPVAVLQPVAIMAILSVVTIMLLNLNLNLIHNRNLTIFVTVSVTLTLNFNLNCA